jgi:UDP-3-O-[3-hydroxymyristoyl] glucosamine N-acyltransferase
MERLHALVPPLLRLETMAQYFAHSSSYIDDGAVIGDGTKIWHFCHVLPGAVIGERCNLGQNVVVMGGVTLGNNVKVQNNVSIYEGVVLEDDVFSCPGSRSIGAPWSAGEARSGRTPPSSVE